LLGSEGQLLSCAKRQRVWTEIFRIYISANICDTEEKAKAAARKKEQDAKAAANNAKVDADIKVKEEAARLSNFGSGNR